MDEKEFIKRIGVIDILCEFSEGERSFGELKDLGTSSGTLSKRLKEAIKMGLIKQEVRHKKNALKPRIVYRLTEEGKDLLKLIKHVRNKHLRIKEEIRRPKMKIKKEEEIQKFMKGL